MKLFSSLLPYLLLVSFYSGQFSNFNIEKINTLNNSPFDGAAVALINAYDTEKHSEKDFWEAIALIKKESKKQIWPWVFFNRFIGHKEGDPSAAPAKANVSYFREIKGVDLYNEKGALGDFKEIWKMALKTAHELGSPGILIDPEAYNDYKNYNIRLLAKQQLKSQEALDIRLKEVGAELADIVNEVYPEATLWFTFTGLTKERFTEKERTVTRIIIGMLQRAKDKSMKLTIVSGVEPPLGYCYEDLADMKDRIGRRNDALKEFTEVYPNLRLGGTIAPWEKPEAKRDWMTKKDCGKSSLSTIGDFKPLITELLKSYQYVWIYAAGAAGYDPYKDTVAPPFNRVFTEAMEEVKK